MDHIYMIRKVLLSVPVFSHKNVVCLFIAPFLLELNIELKILIKQ